MLIFPPYSPSLNGAETVMQAIKEKLIINIGAEERNFGIHLILKSSLINKSHCECN